MWIWRRRRKQLISKRVEYCKGFFEDLKERFTNALYGELNYTFDQKLKIYVENPNATEKNMPLEQESVQTNERIFLCTYSIDRNDLGMTADLTSYHMSEDFGNFSDVWELEYIPRGNLVDVYGRYTADYRFDYHNSDKFVVTECHSGSVKEYDVPFYLTDQKVDEIRRYNPQAKIDFINTKSWRVVCTGQNKAKSFTLEDYRKYRNLWSVEIANSKLKFTPIMMEDLEKNKLWFDKNYITQSEVEWIYAQTRRGQLQIGTQSIQNPKRENTGIRRPSPHEQKSWQA